MNLLFTLILVVLALAAWLFYAKFTKHGAVPLAAAWRSYTVWLAALGTAFGAYFVELLRYFADTWEPLRAQFGDVLGANSAGMALQALSAIFLILRIKGQGLPGLALPSIPDDADQAGA